MWILFLVSGTGISQVKTQKQKKKLLHQLQQKLDFSAFDFVEKRNCKMVKYNIVLRHGHLIDFCKCWFIESSKLNCIEK